LQPNLCRNLQNDISGKNLACNLHFSDFAISSRKHAILQKLRANIEILQFAREFCILGKFCKKVMISKYPPLVRKLES